MLFKKCFIFFVFIGCITEILNGQNKLAAKEIKTLLKEAQYYFDAEDYIKAWEIYKKTLTHDKLNETAGINAAICITKLNYSQDSALVLENNLNNSQSSDAKYFLAKLWHQQKKFDKAIALLEEYGKTNPEKRLINNVEITYLISICSNAKAFIAKPHLSVITNMGNKINSPADDYAPVIMPGEAAVYFTSKRKGSTGGKKNGDNDYYEDIYVSKRDNGVWQEAENSGYPINSDNNDACVALNNDGQRMIVYRTSAANPATGDLYLTQINEHGHWEPLKLMGPEINSNFIETSACFSNNSSEIYFSSNRPGGFGGKDIYRVKRLPNGSWAAPFNIGPSVNTPYDDDAPFLHPDGITLFFSSKGHNTMGGFDVFKSVLDVENNRFSQAENLGYPINDVENDIFFVLSADGERGYYSSVKGNTNGGTDIYQIDTRFGDNDLVVKHCYIYLDNKPGQALITLVDKQNNEVVGNYLSNPTTGKFILALNPLNTYKIIIEEQGFETQENNIIPVVHEKMDSSLIYRLKKNNAQ